MTAFSWKSWRVALTLGVVLACEATPQAANAQFFFRPFAYTYRYDIPPDDYDEAPRFASRRSVARILAREGYQLVGPLGQRGDQVVATGVNRREGEMRFFIDPFEGQIIRAVRIGPPPQIGREPSDGGRVIEPLGGSRPVVRDYGGEPRGGTPTEKKRPGSQEVAAPNPVRPNPVAPMHVAPSHARPQHTRPSPVMPSPARPAPYIPSPNGSPGSKPAPVQPVPTPPSGAAPAPAPTAAAPAKAPPAETAKPAPAVEAAKPVAQTPAPAAETKPPAPVAAEPQKAAAPAPASAEAAKNGARASRG